MVVDKLGPARVREGARLNADEQRLEVELADARNSAR
jgi:hypothetical protein